MGCSFGKFKYEQTGDDILPKGAKKLSHSRYKANNSFEAKDLNELSFHTNDILRVIEKPNKSWFKAEAVSTGKVGMIPSSHVEKIVDIDHVYGIISRSEVSRMFANVETGTFLVRKSNNTNGLVLSVKSYSKGLSENVFHYKIAIDDRGYSIDSAKHYFPNLLELITFYRNNSEGITCKLDLAYSKDQVPRWKAYPGLTDKDEIDRDSIKLDKPLGRGFYGEVWKATVEPGDIIVAVKSVKNSAMRSNELLREAALMKTLRHKHLLSLYGVCSMSKPYYIIMEFMKNGDLLAFLRNKGRNMQSIDILKMAVEIASGMGYLEQKKIVHRDLRAQNILLDEFNKCKISDFGLSQWLDSSEEAISKVPVRWTAPEAYFKKQFSVKSDVWSFGILLVEMITKGESPYDGFKNTEVITLVRNGEYHPRPNNCPDQLYDLMLRCWNRSVNDRPTFEHIQNHLVDEMDTVDGSHYAKNENLSS